MSKLLPTMTGAARALALAPPDLKGRFDGRAMRVPTAMVSVVDLVAQVKQETSRERINAVFQYAVAVQ